MRWLLCLLILLVTQSVMVCGISISAASLPSPARTTVPNEAAVFQIDEEESQEEVMNWLRQQQLEVSIAQANLIQKLRDFQIPVGLPPGSLRKQSEANADDLSQRIITSLPDNHIECRVTLDRVPFGRKCVAPCQCTGSQKWVQFAVLNKLRRKDAQAWVTCPTCRTPYRYDLLLAQSDFKSSLLSTALDNISVVRSVVAGVVVISALKMGVHHLLLRFLLSRSFWQQFPQWSKVSHLPLAMKIWVGKVILGYAWQRYQQYEKDYVVERLATIETEWLERTLPSPNHPSEALGDDEDEDDVDEAYGDYEDDDEDDPDYAGSSDETDN